MKKQPLVLLILSLLLFTNLSCEDKDDNVPVEEAPLTATNYIYEGDLRIYYLEAENVRLNDNIDVWVQVPDNDPGYNDAQENIALAYAEIDANQSEISAIPSPAEAFFIINPILPPIPPSPSPCLCLDEFNSIRNIVFLPGTDQLSLTIRDFNTESVLVGTNNNSTVNMIPNTQNTGRYQPFAFEQPGFTGLATLNIQSDSKNYSILVNFQNLP
ncbi:hypothetical protein [Bizionia arctica]|nr:hypothetical protein [Bizionia arctica]